MGGGHQGPTRVGGVAGDAVCVGRLGPLAHIQRPKHILNRVIKRPSKVQNITFFILQHEGKLSLTINKLYKK